MGSHSFDNTFFPNDKTTTAQEAYRALVEDALYEEGHDGYNGTISTTSGIQQGSTKLMMPSEANKFASSRMDKLSKWDNAEYVRIYNPATLLKRKVVKTVRINAAQIKDLKYPLGSILRAAEEKVSLREGESIEKVETVHENHRPKISAKFRNVVETTEGKSETRYFVTRKGYGDDLDWKQGHATMALARKALIDFMNQPVSSYNVSEMEYEVVARVGRPDTTAMISAKREIVWVEAEVEIEICKPTAKSTTGFLFYGWAAS